MDRDEQRKQDLMLLNDLKISRVFVTLFCEEEAAENLDDILRRASRRLKELMELAEKKEE